MQRLNALSKTTVLLILIIVTSNLTNRLFASSASEAKAAGGGNSYGQIYSPDQYAATNTFLGDIPFNYNLNLNFVPGSINFQFYQEGVLTTSWQVIDPNSFPGASNFTYTIGDDPSTYDHVQSGSALLPGSYTFTIEYIVDDILHPDNGNTVSLELVNIDLPIISGCMDALACNYNALANEDSQSCFYEELILNCQDDITMTLDAGETSAAVAYELPSVEGFCSASLAPYLTSLEELNASAEENYGVWLNALPNIAIFNYDVLPEDGYISDGLDDMYDDGNYLSTDISGVIPYTSGEIVASTSFGDNGRYFTREMPGLFMMAAELDSIENFGIYGELGADGDGAYSAFELNVAGFNAYYKGVCSAGDPSVNHLILISNDVDASHTFATDTDDDQHNISGIEGAQMLYYFLWAGQEGYCYSENEVTDFIGGGIPNPFFLYDGLESGADFPIGTTEVTYLQFVNTEEATTCNFTVTVNSSGCMDSTACNYSELANVDDGSCTYAQEFLDCIGECLNDLNENGICDEQETSGCFDELACNYTPDADNEDSSLCSYECYGCTDQEACNFDETATILEDGVCSYDCYGCTDQTALNYDSNATIDSGDCITECPMPSISVVESSCNNSFLYITLSVSNLPVNSEYLLTNDINGQILFLSGADSELLLTFPSDQEVNISVQSQQFDSCILDLEPISCQVNVEEIDILTVGLYPNPTSDFVKITSESHIDGRIKLYDISGKLVFNEYRTISPSGTEIEVSHLTEGTYIVKINSSVYTTTERLVIVHN